MAHGETSVLFFTIITPDHPTKVPKKYDPVSPKNIFPVTRLIIQKPKNTNEVILRNSLNPSM